MSAGTRTELVSSFRSSSRGPSSPPAALPPWGSARRRGGGGRARARAPGGGDKVVVGVVGEGGFGQNPTVLATAVEHDLPIVFVVMNNNAFGTIAGLQLAHFGTTYGATFPGRIGASLPDYAAIATAYGAVGNRISSADEYGGALERAIGANRPVVLDVPMRNTPTPTTGHWNILDIYSPEGGKSHVATD